MLKLYSSLCFRITEKSKIFLITVFKNFVFDDF